MSRVFIGAKHLYSISASQDDCFIMSPQLLNPTQAKKKEFIRFVQEMVDCPAAEIRTSSCARGLTSVFYAGDFIACKSLGDATQIEVARAYALFDVCGIVFAAADCFDVVGQSVDHWTIKESGQRTVYRLEHVVDTMVWTRCENGTYIVLTPLNI